MKILVALDGSEKSEAVLEPAANLAKAAGAEVLLLSVLDPLVDAAHVTAPSTAEAMKQVSAQRQAYLEQRCAVFDGDRSHARAEPLTHGEDVPAHIARVARDEGADILVLASKRAVGVTGLILGSVAQILLRISPCPVLIVRPA